MGPRVFGIHQQQVRVRIKVNYFCSVEPMEIVNFAISITVPCQRKELSNWPRCEELDAGHYSASTSRSDSIIWNKDKLIFYF